MRHFEQRLRALERRRRAGAARLALLWAIGKEPEQVAAELSQSLAAGAMVLIMDRWPE